MKKQKGLCVEVNDVFYDSLNRAGREIRCAGGTIKRRCLSDKFPGYKFVPFRITYTEKKCKKCGIIKPLSMFRAILACRDGHIAECASCELILRMEGYQRNKERENKYSRKYYQEHKKETNVRLREKRKTDTAFKISDNIRRGINYSLKGKKNGAHWEDIVGWTVKEGRAHLESLFTEGMSWENYGRGGWVLDHIIPIYLWGITSIECQELKDCWSLDNLQPLWEMRNWEKSDKPMEPKYLIKPDCIHVL